MKYLTICLLPWLLLGCATTTTPPEEGRESMLFNPVISATAVEVSVMSYGCTQAAHFYLLVEEDLIELRRTEPDRCRRAPELIRLSFSYDFGQRLYRFRNPLRFNNRVAH